MHNFFLIYKNFLTDNINILIIINKIIINIVKLKIIIFLYTKFYKK